MTAADGIRQRRKNIHAVALAKLGASKGGKISAAKLTAKERQIRAQNAGLARWRKKRKKTT